MKQLEDKKLYDFMIAICESSRDLFKKKKTNVVSAYRIPMFTWYLFI